VTEAEKAVLEVADRWEKARASQWTTRRQMNDLEAELAAAVQRRAKERTA